MNLSKKSWHAIHYKYTYNSLPPNSLCTYFWKLLLSIILFPIIWAGYVIKPIRDTPLFIKFITTFMVIIYLLIGTNAGIILFDLNADSTANVFFAFLVGTVFITIVSALLFGLAFGSFELTNKISQAVTRFRYGNKLKEKKQYIVVEWFKAFIGKYCPKINWK